MADFKLLSEQLKQDNECGYFGRALNGYSERAEALETRLWHLLYESAIKWGSHEQAREFADEQLKKI